MRPRVPKGDKLVVRSAAACAAYVMHEQMRKKVDHYRRLKDELLHASSLPISDPKHVCYSDCPCLKDTR